MPFYTLSRYVVDPVFDWMDRHFRIVLLFLCALPAALLGLSLLAILLITLRS